MGRFNNVTVSSRSVFIVLGELDPETRLVAAYAGKQQAHCDPIGPDTLQPCFWCFGPDGILVLSRMSLAPA